MNHNEAIIDRRMPCEESGHQTAEEAKKVAKPISSTYISIRFGGALAEGPKLVVLFIKIEFGTGYGSEARAVPSLLLK